MSEEIHPDLLLLNHGTVLRLSYELAKKIGESGINYDLIISINREGMVPSRYVSDFLGRLPVVSMMVSSYQGIGEQDDLEIIQDLGKEELEGKTVLLVDELTDGGETLKSVSNMIRQKGAQVTTAVLIKKSKTIFSPDYWMEETDAWVVFPYEIRETMKALGGQINEDNNLKEKLWAYFQDLGLLSDQIEALWKGVDISSECV